MADYYSILKKTVSGLSNNTPEMRLVVYEKARAAIEKQLRGLQPPPSEEAIASQLVSLEAAIGELDAEYSQSDLLDDLDSIIASDELVSQAPAATSAGMIPPSPAPIAPAPANPAAVDPSLYQQPQVSQTPNTGQPVTTTEGALDAMSSAVGNTPPSYEPSEPAPETVSLGADPIDRVHNKPKGKIGKILTTLVILLLLAGGAYALWLNKDALLDASQNVAGNVAETVEEQTTPENSDEAAAIEKEEVKIGTNGQDETPSPIDEQATQGEQTDLTLEPEQTPVVPNPAQDPAQPEVTDPATGLQLETPSAETPPVVEPTQPATDPVIDPVGGADDNAAANVAAPLGEVAYLYEEGSAGAGATRTNAAVAWSIERQQVQPNSTLEPVIIGKMEIPERDVSLNISIKRNIDEALSASHIIEMRFAIPDGFSGQGIEEVARFVMKASEEARGEALVAVPVKVSDGFFLIALDNLPQAVEVNTQLLQTSSWIDIPVSYRTGKRALLTLEKGGTGNGVFAEAFADWKNR